MSATDSVQDDVVVPSVSDTAHDDKKKKQKKKTTAESERWSSVQNRASVTFEGPPPAAKRLDYGDAAAADDDDDIDAIQDHFTLSRPSDVVRFRDMHIHVFDTGSHQMQLVKKRRRRRHHGRHTSEAKAFLPETWQDDDGNDDDDSDGDGNNDDDDDDIGENKYDKTTRTTTTKRDKKTTTTSTTRRRRRDLTETHAKEVEFSSFGLLLLRLDEAVSASIVMGIMFIFFTQFILFLFLSLVMDGGLTSNFQLDIFQFVGTVLSLRYIIFAASSFLSMGTTFVRDTWEGHKALRLMMRWKSVWMEWLSFVAFIGVPLTATLVNILRGVELWWEYSARLWLVTLLAIFFAFCTLTIVMEVQTSLELLLNYNPDTDDATPLATLLEQGHFRRRSTLLAMRRGDHNNNNNNNNQNEAPPSLWELVRRAVLLRQIHRYGGVANRSMILVNNEEAPATASFFQNRAMTLDEEGAKVDSSPSSPSHDNNNNSDNNNNDDEEVEQAGAAPRPAPLLRSRLLWERRAWYTRFTLLLARWTNDRGVFRRVLPHRHFSIDQVLEKAPLVTGKTWSLDRVFCHNKKDPAVLIMTGKSAITPPQALSSVICSFLGNAAGAFLAFCILLWLNLGAIPVVVGTLFLVCFVFGPSFYTAFAFYSIYRQHRQSAMEEKRSRRVLDDVDGNDEEGDDALFKVDETYRITKPTNLVCWVLLGLEFLLLLLYPLLALYRGGNTPLAIAFTMCALTSVFRDYINVSVILQELGSLDFLQAGYLSRRMLQMVQRDRQEERQVGPTRLAWWRRQLSTFAQQQRQAEEEEDERDNEEEMLREAEFRAKNHAARIVGHVSQGHERDGWRAFFLVLTAVVFFLFVSAYSTGGSEGNLAGPPKLVHGFHYEPLVRRDPSLSYPTCHMREGFDVDPDAESSLLDYAYLSWMAYARPEYTAQWLDDWFGPNVAVDQNEYVDQFKERRTDLPSAVHYKLITFPGRLPWLGIVTIRGTATGWDTLTDAQLWMAAVLAQAVRAVLPLGEVWNPVLDEIVTFTSGIERGGLQRVAFYQHTTAFVHHVKQQGNFTTLRVIGHSLGGGLAMITGVQSETPAVALSGPNAVLSRNSFDPPLKLDDLNRLTFNIVPDFDIIPMMDDLAQNVQHISCRAPQNEILGCHNAQRSFCEIMYTCGTSLRPVSCECSLKFGYPEPLVIQNETNVTFAQACGVDQATMDKATKKARDEGI